MHGVKKIPITTGIGFGKTPLSSFDAALYQAGAGDLNLLHLSSVIPCNHSPEVRENNLNSYRQGDRLYCVYASHTTSKAGQNIAAGLGWIQTTHNDPRYRWGLFVEHIGDSDEHVAQQVHESLQSMIQYRSEESWGDIHVQSVSAICEDDPVTVIAMAHYKLEAW